MSGTRRWLQAHVTLEELNGSESLVRARSSGVEWTAQWQGSTHRSEIGAALELYVDPSDLLLFDQSGQALPRRQ